MSYTAHKLAMTHMVRDIHKVDGLIAQDRQGADYPVFPHRDKRKRPVIWLEQAGFHWLRGQGMIEPHTRGYVLTRSVVQRLDAGRGGAGDIGLSTGLGEDADRQHQRREARDIYTPDRVIRAANINTRTTPLDRLARRVGREANNRFLSAAEIEAGNALARDYHRAGEGRIGSQDFTNPGVDGGDRNGAAERAMLARITASTRLRTAREILGPDLAPALIALCCRQENLDEIERVENWAAGSGKQIIKLGLARLVGLYGTEVGSR